MSIRIQADTATVGVSHRFYPDDGKPWGTINFGRTGHANNLYFDNTDDIDAVIAELTALRAEMTGAAAPESSYDLAIRQAEFFAQPGNTIDDVLAAQREAS